MREQERPDFVMVVSAVAATFRTEVTEALLTGFWMGLEDLGLADMKRAATRAIRTSKFMPSVAELRELAGVMAPATRAVLAWEAFKRGLSSHEYYTSVDFDDKVLNAAVRNLGGWVEVAERMDKEDEKWFRKDFERVYAAMAESGINAEQGRYLPGYHERENTLGGYADRIPPPTTVVTGLPLLGNDVVALPEDRKALPELEQIGTMPPSR